MSAGHRSCSPNCIFRRSRVDKTDGDVRIGTFLCSSDARTVHQSKRPANSNSKPGELELAREKAAQTGGDLRLGDFKLAQRRCQDCPLNDDQSKRPANSNSKPGELGLAREKAAQTDGDLRFGDFACTAGMPGLSTERHSIKEAPKQQQQTRRTRTGEKKPAETNGDLRPPGYTVAMTALPNSATYNLRELDKTANNKESFMESHCSNLTDTPTLNGRNAKGYERIQFWLVTQSGHLDSSMFLLRVPEHSRGEKQDSVCETKYKNSDAWKRNRYLSSHPQTRQRRIWAHASFLQEDQERENSSIVVPKKSVQLFPFMSPGSRRNAKDCWPSPSCQKGGINKKFDVSLQRSPNAERKKLTKVLLKNQTPRRCCVLQKSRKRLPKACGVLLKKGLRQVCVLLKSGSDKIRQASYWKACRTKFDRSVSCWKIENVSTSLCVLLRNEGKASAVACFAENREKASRSKACSVLLRKSASTGLCLAEERVAQNSTGVLLKKGSHNTDLTGLCLAEK